MSSDQLSASQDVQVLVPDTEAFVALLHQSDDWLKTLAFAREEFQSDPDPWQFPAPLDDRTAVHAMDRVSTALRQQLTVMWRCEPAVPRLYAPDGRDQHTPIHIVSLVRRDLEVLEAAAHACVHALNVSTVTTNPAVVDLREVIDLVGAVNAPSSTGFVGPDALACVVALFGLPLNTETRILASVVSEQTDHVVLNDAQEAAYQRVVGRWTGLLNSGDTLTG